MKNRVSARRRSLGASFVLVAIPLLALGGVAARADEPPTGKDGKEEPPPPPDTQLPDVTVYAPETPARPDLGVPVPPPLVVPVETPTTRDVLLPARVEEVVTPSVEDVARRLPGVTTRLYQGDEWARPSISSRGMWDNGFTEYVSVLVDGVNYGTMPYGWTALQLFPFTPERIWAAEVYRGGSATRWGPNTIGGVVNFLTRPIPESPFYFRTRDVLGSFGYHSEVVEVGGTDCRSGVGALLTIVDKGGDTFRENSMFRVFNADLKARWQVTPCAWIASDLSYWAQDFDIPDRLTRAQYDADRDQDLLDLEWHGDAFRGSLTFHQDVAAGWLEVYANGGTAWMTRDIPRGAHPATTIRYERLLPETLDVGVRGERTFATGGVCHVLHAGARWHGEWLDRLRTDTPYPAGTPTTVEQESDFSLSSFGVHADDTMTFGRFTVQPGVRFEWIAENRGHDDVTGLTKNYEIDEVSPGVSASFLVSPSWALFASWQRSFRPPQVFSFEWNRPAQELDFEHGETWEVGVRWDTPCVQASVTAYRVAFSDFIQVDPNTSTTTNYGAFRSEGVEVRVESDLGRWAGLCGWSVYANAIFNDSEYTKREFDGNDVQYVPDRTIQAGVRYEHPYGLYGLLEFTAHPKVWANPENTLKSPAVEVFDGRVGWRRRCVVGCAEWSWDVSLAAHNLFDREYFSQYNATTVVPAPPREVYLDLSLSIRL